MKTPYTHYVLCLFLQKTQNANGKPTKNPAVISGNDTTGVTNGIDWIDWIGMESARECWYWWDPAQPPQL